MVNGSIHGENTATVNTGAANNRTPKYILQKLTELN